MAARSKGERRHAWERRGEGPSTIGVNAGVHPVTRGGGMIGVRDASSQDDTAV